MNLKVDVIKAFANFKPPESRHAATKPVLADCAVHASGSDDSLLLRSTRRCRKLLKDA
jgi:hypothetical protein